MTFYELNNNNKKKQMSVGYFLVYLCIIITVSGLAISS